MEKFNANETKNTCCINAKIVPAHFVAKGVSPHLLLLPSKLRPASNQVGYTDFHLETLSNKVSLTSKIEYFWTVHAQECF